MKKYWLLPVLAIGISLGIYSCNKSASPTGDPAPRTITTNEEAESNTVSDADFEKEFESYLEIAEGGAVDMLIRRSGDGHSYIVQYIKSDGHPASQKQICVGSQGMSLGYCVGSFIHDHPDTPVTINNCGDTDPKTHCAWIP